MAFSIQRDQRTVARDATEEGTVHADAKQRDRHCRSPDQRPGMTGMRPRSGCTRGTSDSVMSWASDSSNRTARVSGRSEEDRCGAPRQFQSALAGSTGRRRVLVGRCPRMGRTLAGPHLRRCTPRQRRSRRCRVRGRSALHRRARPGHSHHDRTRHLLARCCVARAGRDRGVRRSGFPAGTPSSPWKILPG